MKATKENKIIGIGSVVEIYDCDLEEKKLFYYRIYKNR